MSTVISSDAHRHGLSLRGEGLQRLGEGGSGALTCARLRVLAPRAALHGLLEFSESTKVLTLGTL